MTDYEIIRHACIKANPEIQGQHYFEIGNHRCKFCDIERIVRDRKILSRVVDEGSGGSIQEVEVKEYNMEGGPCPKHASRSIRLADVLVAIASNRIRLDTFVHGEAWFTEYREVDVFKHTQGWVGTGIKWHLRNDDLHKQSPGTLKFLAKLLK